MEVCIGFDQDKCPLADIDLIHVLLRLHICKFFYDILTPINSDLIANEKILLLNCFVSYPSQVYFAIALIDELNGIVTRVK